ncbi:MAG: PTS system mannose-specific EIIBCA component [Verrucomicrobia bacterium ADurb.Bin345]|nr:MAG: PTS system mannose-specific EIIBCA component [Verrucomicrobia bacterium ADurb.Bin345]
MTDQSISKPQGAARSTKGLMQKTINHLIQLQDLLIARAQQEASMEDVRLEQLDAAIQAMYEQLPPPIAAQFKRIEKKAVLGIVPVANGVCSACGMSLPVSLVHSVHAADRLHTCPNCARMLFYPESSPRNIGKRQRRSEPPKVGIERFSAPELMIPDLASTERDDVLAELCSKMEAEGFVDNGRLLLEEALKREAIAGTAIGHSLAFPHVRGVEGGGLTLALGVSAKGVKFGGPGRALTRIVFFMVIPTAASAFYLKLLSGLAQVFQKEEAREKLMGHDSPEKLWKALIKVTKPLIR